MTTVDEQARRYLRLFPEWLRPTRGEEAIGLVLDQLPPGAEQLPWRSKIDLVRAGLHARRIGTPPLWVWSRVAMSRRQATKPIPLAWLPWLSTLVRRRSFPLLMVAVRSMSIVAMAVWYTALPVNWPASMLGLLAVWVPMTIHGLARGRTLRTAACAKHGLGPDGRPLPPSRAEVRWTVPPVANRALRPLAEGALLGSLASVGPAWWWYRGSTLDPILEPLVLVGTVIGAGAALGLLVRILGARASSSEGALEPAGWSARMAAALAFGAGVGCSMAAAWASSAIGQPVLAALVPLVLGSICGAILRAEHRTGRSLGLWDIARSWAPQPVVSGDVGQPRPGPGAMA